MGSGLDLNQITSMDPLKEFVLDKPILKKVVFRTLEVVCPRLYQVYFQDDH